MALFGSKKTQSDSSATPKAAKATAPKAVKTAATSANPASMKDLYASTAPATVTAKKGGAKKATADPRSSRAHSVLIKPLVTEKATNLGAQNQYVFMVAKTANKIEVAKAITAVYQVKPTSVNLINVLGKKVARGRIRGSRKNWKKAIVTLAAGQTIKVYEGV